MVSFTRVDSFEELIEDVKSQNKRTIFEYEYLAFENHREYIEFLIESDEPFYDSFVARVGRSQDVRELFNQREFIGEFVSGALDVEPSPGVGVQNPLEGVIENPSDFLHQLVNQDELCVALQDSEADVSFLNGLKFARDVLKYRRNRIIETDDWEQVLDDIVEVYDFPGCTESEAREEVLDILREQRESLVEAMESFEQSVEPLEAVEQSNEKSDSIEGDAEEESVVSPQELFASTDLSEIGVNAVQMHADFLQGLVNVYDYQMVKEPSVGEYAVFEFDVPESEDRSDEVSAEEILEEHGVSIDELGDDELEGADREEVDEDILDAFVEWQELQESLKPDRYRVVVEIVGREEVIVNGISFYEYLYEVVEYPDERVPDREENSVLEGLNSIRPANQESYVRAKSRPNVDLIVPFSESFKSSSQLDRTGSPLS